MERLGVLINKLQEQFQQHEDLEKLTITAQMLLAELDRQKTSEANNSHRKISVVMPASRLYTNVVQTTEIPSVNQIHEQEAEEPAKPIEPAKIETQTTPVEKPDYFNKIFDPVHEVPTLTHQTKNKTELNDVMLNNQLSMNDRLKTEKTELAATLKDAPIKDLRKAIGINDRYLFVNELFRGDETMYERSIKTINAFSILAEAEFWIQRELKLKLGWDEENETVHFFDKLVRRRFA